MAKAGSDEGLGEGSEVTRSAHPGNPGRSIRTLIADDHPVVRAGLSAMLSEEADLEIVGEAKDGREAVDAVRTLHPDVVLMDLRMPGMDGAEAMNRIRDTDPNVKFIVLTTYDSDEYIFKGIEAGARAFLLKDSPGDELVKAIRSVHKGESLIQPTVASKMLDRFVELSHKTRESNALTERELDVLKLMAQGISNKNIAAQLFVSESTVKARIASIFHKLDADDRTEAVARALDRGVIQM